ncbi:hypothetical protein SELMODRAFT_72063, partial [Selaginella moellendorffii]
DRISWTAMAAAFASNGFAREAIHLVWIISLEGLRADEAAFSSVLSAASRVGRLEDAIEFFVSMIGDHGLAPVREHYCCVVDGLARAGRLADAEELVESMPFLPGDTAWGSLLTASRTQRDLDRGERSSGEMGDLDPSNAAPLKTMFNIYKE